jgi:hypothetical protein
MSARPPARVLSPLPTCIGITCHTGVALAGQRELKATLFIEMAPGHVSTHLMPALFPSVRAASIADQSLHYATVLAARKAWVCFRNSCRADTESRTMVTPARRRPAMSDPSLFE